MKKIPYFILLSQVKGKLPIVDSFTGNRNYVDSAIRFALGLTNENKIIRFISSDNGEITHFYTIPLQSAL